MKKRKGTPLSLYYPSVTGLLGSCYGYWDSRLSVLLTIAHKGSIQLLATMQIGLSLFFSFLLPFLLFTCIYILCSPFMSVFSLSLKLHTELPGHLPLPPTLCLMCLSSPLSHPFYTLLSLSDLHHHRRHYPRAVKLCQLSPNSTSSTV